jgi:serine/threonine-protein kinase
MPTPTERLSTAVSDRYRIERHLGEGGMATVFLAHDLKHDRRVALKVLRPELAAVIGAERFLAEIRTTANLQHPNILPLFDSGEADGQLFYVMPYVEGLTLRDRIQREKQLPLDDVVRLGSEVASALDYAHRQGVVHRDIKPENILLHDGRALVADFGIALAVSTAGSRMTETGMSVGTPHYMSPEQAMGGHDVTARSDVYSLGATLYEALVGEPPFTGSTAQAIIARIVTEDPRPLTRQRKTIPAHVEGAVLTALQRLPADRFDTAAAFGEALEGRGRLPTLVASRTSGPGSDHATGIRLTRRVALLATAGVLALAGAAFWGWLRPLPTPPVERLRVDLGLGGAPYLLGAFAALAHDGSALVYFDNDGTDALRIKERGEVDAHVLVSLPIQSGFPGPSFSPDGSWVAYTDGKLKRVSRAGGVPVVLSDSSAINGAAWLDDGTIVFSSAGGLYRTDADGGATETIPITGLVRGGLGFGRPSPVPGARAVLVAVGTSSPSRRTVAVDIDTGAWHEIGNQVAGAWMLEGGTILYAHLNGEILAAPFDTRTLEITGPGVPVASGMSFLPMPVAPFVAGADGTLLYPGGTEDFSASMQVTLASVTPQGVEVPLGIDGLAPFSGLGGFALSPDGARVAVTSFDSIGNSGDIYIVPLTGEPESRLTFSGGLTGRPAWSPDGTWILYTSYDDDDAGLWSKRADGVGAPVSVVSEERAIVEGQWSPDGEWVVYRTDNIEAGNGDILAVRVEGDTSRVPLAVTDAQELTPTLSPDGRWLAYTVFQDRDSKVFVVPFPAGWDAGHWEVSSATGGSDPQWSRDGNTLYYVDMERQMVAVDVTTTPTFAPRARRTLFDASPYFLYPPVHSYAVLPDGKGFLMLKGTEGATDPVASGAHPVVLVRHQLPELRARIRQGG